MGGFGSGFGKGLTASDSNLSKAIGGKLGAEEGKGSNLSKWIGGKLGIRKDTTDEKGGGSIAQGTSGGNAGSASMETAEVKKHKGGRIPKTATYRLKKGEFVLSASNVKHLEKRLKSTRKVGRKSGRR